MIHDKLCMCVLERRNQSLEWATGEEGSLTHPSFPAMVGTSDTTEHKLQPSW